MLLTDVPEETFAQAWDAIECYEWRWVIEEYHKVLMTGCNLEGDARGTVDRQEAVIGLSGEIGVRLLTLKMEGSHAPDTRQGIMFRPHGCWHNTVRHEIRAI